MAGRADGSEDGFWSDADADVALRQFEMLVDVVDDGIYQLDAAGRFVAVNEAVVDLTGYPRDELLGSHVSLVIDDDDVDRSQGAIEAALESGSGLEQTFSFTLDPAEE